MKKKLAVFLSMLIVLSSIIASALVPASAVNFKNDVKLRSRAVLLINMDTGQTVFEKNSEKKVYPASTTKIMTYVIVAENITNFKKTKDAAMVLADFVGGGDINKFVEMMNKKAKELGCKNTHFANPDGLHDKNHYTTASDMAKITQYALTLPEFSTITNTTTYYVKGDSFPLTTTNYLIDANRGGNYYYPYAQGIKTGTTDEAGHCLVTMGAADGYSYLGVFMKNKFNPENDVYGTMLDAKEMFRWALTQLELNQVASKETPICEEKVNLAWGKNSVQLVPEKNINAIVPNDFKESDIVIETKVPDSVDAPIKEGDVIGKATVYYKGEQASGKQELGQVNLVSSETIERSGILYVLSVVQSIVVSNWFIIIIAVIVVLLIIYIIISSIIRRRSRRRRRNVKRYRNF